MFSFIRMIQINESITHLEDLGVEDFLSQIENISKLVATEKLDGANLHFGLDKNGKFYTSRAGKGGVDLRYGEKDYEDRAAWNGFKAAHAALQQDEKLIKKILSPGEAIEIEVIFGRQPNAVVYGADGANFIAFLRAVPGTNPDLPLNQEHTEKLASAFASKTNTVKTGMIDTDDGEKLKKVQTQSIWKFIKAVDIASKEIEKIDLKSQIKKLRKFLDQPNEVAKKLNLGLSNLEVSGISLTKIDKSLRDEVKAERENVNRTILNDFKLPIKEKLLNGFVRKIKPKLQAEKIESEEDIGIEGIVLRNPETEDLIKIVDKDMFTTVNKFNYAIRNQLSGIVKTDDPLADAETRGGLFGDAKIRIAALFGVPGLAKSSMVKKTLEKFKGKSEEETANNFAKSLGGMKAVDVKTKIVAIFKNLLSDVAEKLKTFKAENSSYKLELANGKTIGYSKEIIRRTLVSFAELKTEVEELVAYVESSKSIGQIIYGLYNSQLKSIHGKEISESLIKLFEAPDSKLARLKSMSHDEICNAFMATYLASLLLLRVGDTKASSILKDNIRNLKDFQNDSSPLSFWGLIVMRPDHKSVQPHLDKETFKYLKKTSGRIIENRIKNIFNPISANNNLIQNWEQHDDNIKLLSVRLGIGSANINMIKIGISNWDDLGLSNKSDVVAKVFYFLMQHVNDSPLLPLIRKLANKVLLTATDQLAKEPEEVVTMQSIAIPEGWGAEDVTKFKNGYAVHSKGGKYEVKRDGKKIYELPIHDMRTALEIMKADALKNRVRLESLLAKINACINEDGEGGGEGGEADTSGMTTSSSIATYPTRLFPGNNIIKRARPDSGLPKKKKKKKPLLSLIKNISEEDAGGGEGGAEANLADPSKYMAIKTDNNAISPKEYKIFNGKIIKRKKRNYKKKGLFARPVALPKKDNNE